jgi:signal transduction histidine kinase/CheY-like chemotaxis protein
MQDPQPHSSDEAERQRLLDAMHAAGHGVWDWNLRDRTASYSDELRALLGVDRQAFRDEFEAFTSRLHRDDAGRVLGAVSSHLGGHGDFDLEFRMRAGDGSWKWVRARGRAILEGGQAVRMVGTLTPWPLQAARDQLGMSASDRLSAALEDKSRVARELEAARAELLEQNEELRRARAASEAAAASKSMFLANISHEIRTPMSAILGFLDVLLDDGIGIAEREGMRRAIRRNSEHLLELINDLLDLGKIEAGGMRVERVPTDALRMVVDCVIALQNQAHKRGLELHAVLRGEVPAVVHTDPHRLRQILTNLIGNAIKFTHHGGIQLEVSMIDGPMPPRLDDEVAIPPEPRRLRVAVIDTGIGIDDAAMSRLFRPFAQGDDSMTRRFGGTGLGLAISRYLARMLGGDIMVTSQEGAGSTFIVEIGTGPIDGVPMVRSMPVDAEIEPPSTHHEAAKPGPSVRVLVAEDGDDNRRLVMHHLSRGGIEAGMASNGREAVELAQASLRTGSPFEVILMDMQMPELDGYEATRLLRASGWKGPIVALTAHAMSGDRERCIEAGCDEYLTKPIDRKVLVETVRRLAARGR